MIADQPNGRGLEPSADPVGLAIFAAVFAAVYLRLFYGLDFTDDSFYIGLPYAFALGHRPLVDELAAHQFAGLLLLPAVKAYLGVVGSNAGLVLFARHLYLALSLAAALLARQTLSSVFGSRAGNLLAALSLGYIPFLLPSLSYNSIMCLCMLAGVMLLASASLPGRSPTRLGLGVASVALASFAYPPVLVAALVAIALGLLSFCSVREPELWRRAVLIVAGTGLASAGAAVALLFHFGGVAELQRLADLNAAFEVQGGGSAKLELLLAEILYQRSYFIVLPALLVAIVCGLRWIRARRLAVAAAALTGPALLAAESLYLPLREPYATAPFVLMTLGVLAPIGLLLARNRLTRNASAALLVVVVPSILCAGVVVWATANGFRNGALGLLPACLVGVGCIAGLRPGEPSRGLGFPRASIVFTTFAASLLAFQIFEIWTHVYRDHPISELSATVEQGAFAGIHTTNEKKAFLRTFEQDLAKVRGSAQTVLFTDYFPGGYLLSDLRPRTPAIWLFPWNDIQQGNREIREIYARNFADLQSFPDLIVRIKCVPADWDVPVPMRANDPLALRLLQGGYQRVTARDCYTISKRRKPRG